MINETKVESDRAPADLVLAPAPRTVLVPTIPGLRSYGPTAIGSLVDVGRETAVQLYRMRALTGVRAETMIGQPWPTTDVVVVLAEAEMDGELSAYCKLCLVREDGTWLETGSGPALRSLAQLIDQPHFGPPPWSPPLPLVLREGKSKKGRRYYYLDVQLEHSDE